MQIQHHKNCRAKHHCTAKIRFQHQQQRCNCSDRNPCDQKSVHLESGGAAASLQLTGEDLLGAGVTLMARPPGKRNTGIAALSGGEKSLTAIALVFAIFELNPAPFCLLDEVDAPLDDANIGRFRELVVEMAKRVQLVLVTHNKITMEIAAQLVGITMNEPGVSRLVVVDVEEALEMARA